MKSPMGGAEGTARFERLWTKKRGSLLKNGAVQGPRLGHPAWWTGIAISWGLLRFVSLFGAGGCCRRGRCRWEPEW